jgi:glycopeptide antibiotics resistance protein
LGWLVVGVLFALSTEAIQYLLPYRAFNINDLLANGFGVILGFVFFISYWSVVGSSPLGERGVRKAIKKS